MSEYCIEKDKFRDAIEGHSSALRWNRSAAHGSGMVKRRAAAAWPAMHSNAVARRCEGKARQGDGEAGQSDEKARRGGGQAKQLKASEWHRPAEAKHGTDKAQQRLARAKLRKDGNG